MYSSSSYTDFLANDYAGLRGLIQHELSHTIVYTLSNDRSFGTYRWFDEGMATWIGRFPSAVYAKNAGTTEGRTTASVITGWTSSGYKNPISIQKYTDTPSDNFQDNYILYALIVEWLTDTTENGGAGNTLADVAKLYKYRASTGADFGSAFSQYMKRNGAPLTISDLQTNWQTWINDYLSKNTTALAFNQVASAASKAPVLTVTPLTAVNGAIRTVTIQDVPGTTPVQHIAQLGTQPGKYTQQVTLGGVKSSFPIAWVGVPGTVYVSIIEVDSTGKQMVSNEVTVVITAPTLSDDVELFFNWAEKTYPDLFYPPSVTADVESNGYRRVYSGSGAKLSVMFGNQVRYWGPLTNYMDTLVGSFSTFLSQAKGSGK